MTFAGDASGFQVGLALGVASMVSVGPNNLMLMREGVARGRTGLVASLVLSSYVVLIAASVLLASLTTRIDPALTTVLTVSGFLAISWFALQSLRAAMAQRRMDDWSGRSEPAASCLARVMRVVWMNPLTYLELLIVPAALCQSFGAGNARLDFVAALILMAALCCYGYALGGRLIASVLQSRTSLRIFDLVSGLILSAVAASMAAGFVTGSL